MSSPEQEWTTSDPTRSQSTATTGSVTSSRICPLDRFFKEEVLVSGTIYLSLFILVLYYLKRCLQIRFPSQLALNFQSVIVSAALCAKISPEHLTTLKLNNRFESQLVSSPTHATLVCAVKVDDPLP